MSRLFEVHEHPTLDAPVMLLALDGWIDAGYGAATARSAILEGLDLVPVATFDTDRLLDHRARRPVMHLVDGVNTGLTWPTIELAAATDRGGRDVVVLAGPEPDHEWRAFSDAVVDLGLDLGVRMVVGLGAYPAPAPHTRPALLASTATSEELAAQVGFVRGTLDVPAGVQAAIEQRCAAAGVPAIGVWAQVPHYAATMTYPAASLALIEGIAQVAGLDLDSGNLAREAAETRDRLDAAVAANPEHQQLVAALEEQFTDQQTASGDLPTGELPTGDELADELQRFLREQGDG